MEREQMIAGIIEDLKSLDDGEIRKIYLYTMGGVDIIDRDTDLPEERWYEE